MGFVLGAGANVGGAGKQRSEEETWTYGVPKRHVRSSSPQRFGSCNYKNMGDVTTTSPPTRSATGIEGLDDVLGGGFPRHRVYLLQGDPGAGKTTAALQYLLHG